VTTKLFVYRHCYGYPAMSDGDVFSFLPSNVVLNCSGITYSFCNRDDWQLSEQYIMSTKMIDSCQMNHNILHQLDPHANQTVRSNLLFLLQRLPCEVMHYICPCDNYFVCDSDDTSQ